MINSRASLLAFAPRHGVTATDRVDVVRAAFDAKMRDPEFITEAERLKIEVNPVLAANFEAVIERALKTPPPIAARARPILEQ